MSKAKKRLIDITPVDDDEVVRDARLFVSQNPALQRYLKAVRDLHLQNAAEIVQYDSAAPFLNKAQAVAEIYDHLFGDPK